MRELADHCGCDASYVTTIVDGLEDKGYAERRPHPTDRRVKAIALTEAGAEAKAKAMAVLHAPPEALDRLSAGEQRQLRDLLRKVAAAP
jgi:DNA-binding MarR family transcriptional regulator